MNITEQTLVEYFTTKYPGQLKPGYTTSGKTVLFFAIPDRVWHGMNIYSGFILDEANNRLLELLNLPTDQVIKTPEYIDSKADNVIHFRKNLEFSLHYQIHKKESQITWV